MDEGATGEDSAGGTSARKRARLRGLMWLFLALGLGYALGAYTFAAMTRGVPKILGDLRLEEIRLQRAEVRAQQLRAELAARAADLMAREASLAARQAASHRGDRPGPLEPRTPPVEPGPSDFQELSFFEVGVDLEPGTYETAGPARGLFGVCSWALSNLGGTGISEGHATYGPAVVGLESGTLFVTRGCQKWRRQDQ
ncbi:MAG: hypothetical protein M3N52_01980 [Actinomycetota bacterium]|nr:hypothetical protein [Actinomycetota bacterium]